MDLVCIVIFETEYSMLSVVYLKDPQVPECPANDLAFFTS